MAKDPRYKVKFRRYRNGKTDYRLRKEILKSGKIMFTPRPSLNGILVQIIMPKIGGDVIISSSSSRLLVKKFGWKYHTGNTPAAYLVGLIAGLEAIRKGVKEAVLYVGRYTITRGSRIFAAVRGAIDAGLNIVCNNEMLPSVERIRGLHIAKYAEKLQVENPTQYQRQFSKYISNNLSPADLPLHFDEIKLKILKSYGR